MPAGTSPPRVIASITSYSLPTRSARSATIAARASHVTTSLSSATLILARCLRASSGRVVACRLAVAGDSSGDSCRARPPDGLDRRRVVEGGEVAGVQAQPRCSDDASHDLARSGLGERGDDGDGFGLEGLAQ